MTIKVLLFFNCPSVVLIEPGESLGVHQRFRRCEPRSMWARHGESVSRPLEPLVREEEQQLVGQKFTIIEISCAGFERWCNRDRRSHKTRRTCVRSKI